jgi:hypothetical protein
MEYAFEGETLADTREAEPSVFTSALVKGLETGDADRDQDGLVALDELYDYIYDKVRTATPHQTPGKWTFGVQGELVIARRSRPVTTPAQLPREIQEAIDSPLAAVRAAAVQELARLMTARHAGVALAARLALERFTSDDSRAVAAAATAALGSQPPSPAGATSPQSTPATALPAAGAATAPPMAPAETGSPPPNVMAPPAGRATEAPEATAAADPPPAVSAAPPAVSAEKEAEAPAPPPATQAAKPPPPPAEPADRLRLVAGALAITAAILGIAALFPTYLTVSQVGYSLGGLPFTRWYVILVAVADLVAGACLLAPRTRRLIGPGILLGDVAISAGGLALLIVTGLSHDGLGGGFWFALAASLAEVSAACVAGAAVAQTPEIRLPHWPARTGLAWLIILIGAAAAVPALIYAQRLSAASVGGYWTISIWTAVMAVAVPLIATSAVPAQFATAVLGGWVGGNVVVFAYYAFTLGYADGHGAHVTPVPVIWFGLALAALVVFVTLFARAAAQRQQGAASAPVPHSAA